MKFKIKKGAMVGQDYGWFKWGNDQTVFIASEFITNGRRRCIGDGYGEFAEGKQYGSGAVYVNDCDLVPADEAIKLTEVYEKETGRIAIYNKKYSGYYTLKYVKWLEARCLRNQYNDTTFSFENTIDESYKDSGTPCGNTKCSWNDKKWEANCGAESPNGDPYIAICMKYERS